MKKQAFLSITGLFSVCVMILLYSCNTPNSGGAAGGQASNLQFATVYMSASAFINIWQPPNKKVSVSFRFNFNDTGITLHGWPGDRGSYKPNHEINTYVVNTDSSQTFKPSYYVGTLRLDSIYIDSLMKSLSNDTAIDNVIVLFVPQVSAAYVAGGSNGYPPYRYANHVYYEIYIANISNGEKVKKNMEKPLIVKVTATGLSLNPSPPANQ